MKNESFVSHLFCYNHKNYLKVGSNFKNILELALQSNATVVYASSAATYGDAVSPQRVGHEQPQNVYGFSKAIAEHIFLNAASYSRSGGTDFVVTRFGNVANSTGSIIPVWAKRKADGLICEMRDPDVTRFWMTRNEAVAFVFAAATEFEVSRVHIPELPGYRLQDLADAMGVETKLTELLPGEKKHETMDGVTDSSHARRMSVDELREALNEIL